MSLLVVEPELPVELRVVLRELVELLVVELRVVLQGPEELLAVELRVELLEWVGLQVVGVRMGPRVPVAHPGMKGTPGMAREGSQGMEGKGWCRRASAEEIHLDPRTAGRRKTRSKQRAPLRGIPENKFK